MKIFRLLLLLPLLASIASLRAQTPQPIQAELPPAEYEAQKLHGTLPPNARPTQVHLDQAVLDSIVAANGGWQRGGGGGNGGACGLWQDPDGCPVSQPPSDDGSSGLITLPFSFNLYGTNYSSLYINNNGNVTFNAPYGTFSATPFPNTSFVMVAPFWADVETDATHGNVYYCLSDHALFVNWIDVGYFYEHYDKINNFQLILTDGTDDYIGVGNNVDFSYLDMQWTTGDASGGSNGFGGTPAVVGANLGNGTGYISIGKFDHAGTDYAGPTGNSGVSWLDYKDFVFSTTVASANIAPIATGNFVCDTVVVCTGVPVDINMSFLAPEPTQTITPTFSAPDFPQFNPAITTGTTGTIDGILVPTVDQVGFHTITFTGTDDGTPNLSQTSTVAVQVVLSPNLGSDSASFCDTDPPVDMLTLITGSPTPGGTWTDITGQPVSNIFTPGTTPDGDYLYTVDNGGGCAATATATITNVPHAYAGEDTALAYCSWDYPDLLFPHIPGSPQTGGAWIDPNGLAFDGNIDPSTSTPGTYLYVVTPPTPCPNDTAAIAVAIPQAVYAGTDSSIVICRDTPPFSMRSKLGGQVDTTGTWTNTLGVGSPGTELEFAL